MLIANPIYDAVFKFLLEDSSIAKGLLEVILDEEIEALDLKPIETATTTPTTGLTVLRYDFKAVVKNKKGERKKVLIELQKAKHLLDIMRFRRYLGENYRKPDEHFENEQLVTEPLDIITVYFLGFKLNGVECAVLKSNNCYEDVLAGRILEEKVKEPFVNLLDHEAYFIQIPRLKPQMRTRLENVLLVFSQENITEDHRQLNYGGSTSDELVGKMIQRLVFANADENLQRQMEVEEEVENLILEKDRIIETNNQQLEQKDKLLSQKNQQLEQKDKLLSQKERELEQQNQQLELLRKKLMEAGLNPGGN